MFTNRNFRSQKVSKHHLQKYFYILAVFIQFYSCFLSLKNSRIYFNTNSKKKSLLWRIINRAMRIVNFSNSRITQDKATIAREWIKSKTRQLFSEHKYLYVELYGWKEKKSAGCEEMYITLLYIFHLLQRNSKFVSSLLRQTVYP